MAGAEKLAGKVRVGAVDLSSNPGLALRFRLDPAALAAADRPHLLVFRYGAMYVPLRAHDCACVQAYA